ncbi:MULTISPECIES: hypothetical protein [Streptomyces]|uniref:hypothetical protein n=1 Tax=Streptomyces TaxID=1883 RepID=UPI0006EB6C95|nr:MULTISPECIES: hypothetical protein [Streptomyces]
MGEKERDEAPKGERDAAESLRECMRALLDSEPAPPPVLNDEELLAKIRETAAKTPPEEDFD